MSYATRALGIIGKATLALWTKNRSKYEQEGAAGVGGVRDQREEKGIEDVFSERWEGSFSAEA